MAGHVRSRDWRTFCPGGGAPGGGGGLSILASDAHGAKPQTLRGSRSVQRAWVGREIVTRLSRLCPDFGVSLDCKQEPLLFIVLCHANGFDPLTMPPIHRIWITCTRRCQLRTKDGLHR